MLEYNKSISVANKNNKVVGNLGMCLGSLIDAPQNPLVKDMAASFVTGGTEAMMGHGIDVGDVQSLLHNPEEEKAKQEKASEDSSNESEPEPHPKQQKRFAKD